MLARWADYIRVNGYYADNPESNYGAGAYASSVMTGLALKGRSSEGQRLLDEALSWRRNNLLPMLSEETNSLKGGFWVEGWSYGFHSAQALIIAGGALENAGLISAQPERHWASEVVRQLVSAQPAKDQVHNAGDWYMWPTRFIDKSLFYVLGAYADDPDARSYANHIVQNYLVGDFFHEDGADINAKQPDTADAIDLLFHDPGQQASFWSALPLEHYSTGAGLVTARSDWGPTPTWVSLQMGNLLHADHQTYSPGQLQIQRGDDELLANALAPTLGGDNNLNPTEQSAYGNLVAISDNNEGAQRAPFCMGVSYGNPGVFIRSFEASDDHVYVDGDYRAAYNPDPDSGFVNPANELTRQVVYLRPDYVIVYDRFATRNEAYAKQLRWNFLSPPTVNANSFVETRGESRLFGQTFSTTPIRTSVSTIFVPTSNTPVPISRLTTENLSPTSVMRCVTAFQVAEASKTAADPVSHILSDDDRLEGVLMGEQLVLFGRDGSVDLDTPVSYRLNKSGTVQNLITNLSPWQNYLVTVDDGPPQSVTASPQGTIRFTTVSESSSAVRISRLP